MSRQPWWAGLRPVGGAAVLAVGAALLLWLVLSGKSFDEDWASYYGAGRVAAIGCVVAGVSLLTRRRGDDPARSEATASGQ
ncbi:hypothetical protein J7I94_22660 [Streptomyces sp. ISL-12]|uniref:hypothetical protein n=1 Tax=Streptomyces sp. ISL-12 TaxID=2819177 RepID=UPI001BE598A0|nr:hypothetical protein [Streptomyces sp. ISL-12]MBT2413330.1 hypothetical protein [Streptomyces sp. ISL-12]